ncbi:MAG: hypothetical protein WCO79_01850 [bacterium]
MVEYETYEENKWSLGFKQREDIPHYFGHTIRRFFFASAFTMLATLPFFKNELAIPVGYSVFAIIAVTFAAGYTNPHSRWILMFDSVIAALGLLVFGFHSVTGYSDYGMEGLRQILFYTNQVLAMCFLAAFYFSVKSLRGFSERPPMGPMDEPTPSKE